MSHGTIQFDSIVPYNQHSQKQCFYSRVLCYRSRSPITSQLIKDERLLGSRAPFELFQSMMGEQQKSG
uniref:Uncharacterized protein n=1 Tax=Rhizophora mucronata TaxID=61149 RepID=A0A2P2JEA8_RHIMU